MNEMETQLSRLFNAAVGEPPNHVTAGAARRQAIKRRVIACVSATAALVLAGSIGLAVAANAIAPHRPATGHPRLTMPKYYFEMTPGPAIGHTENLVRSVSTGAVTGQVHCPGPRWMAASAAVDGHQTFFVACLTYSHTGTDHTRVYRFQVSGTGRVSGFRLLPGGDLPDFQSGNMAVTQDGSLLAIVDQDQPNVLVINTKTGSHSVWRSNELPGRVFLTPGDVSFARGDRELAIFATSDCQLATRCKLRGEMLAFSSPAKGGTFSSGRPVLNENQLSRPGRSYIANVVIAPDGTTVTATVNTWLAAGGLDPGIRIVRFSLATGKTLNTLFNPASFKVALITAVDQSGRFVLLKALKKHDQRPVFGWIDHGKLRPLSGFADVAAW